MRLAAATFVIGIVIGVVATTWSDGRLISELQKNQTERLADLVVYYADMKSKQECLERLLSWASDYIPTLDIPILKNVSRECYTRVR